MILRRFLARWGCHGNTLLRPRRVIGWDYLKGAPQNEWLFTPEEIESNPSPEDRWVHNVYTNKQPAALNR